MKKIPCAFLVVLCLCGFAPAAPPGIPTQTILIGHAAPFKWLLPLHSLQAAQQAVEDANLKNIRIGGRTLEFRLIAKDDDADSRVARFIAKPSVDSGGGTRVCRGEHRADHHLGHGRTNSATGIPGVSR